MLRLPVDESPSWPQQQQPQPQSLPSMRGAGRDAAGAAAVGADGTASELSAEGLRAHVGAEATASVLLAVGLVSGTIMATLSQASLM